MRYRFRTVLYCTEPYYLQALSYLGTVGSSQLFFAIEIPRFADTGIFTTIVGGWIGLTWKEFEQPTDFIHKQGGAYVVSPLIAAHAGAALYHHFVRNDIVLTRMLSVDMYELAGHIQ